MEIKDSNITIMVKDMNAAVSFYQSIGLTVKQRWADHYAQLTAPGITIGLHPAGDGNYANGSSNISIGFTTENLEATTAAMQQLHITVTPRNEDGGQFLHFTDPDGTALYFIKPKW